MKRNESAVAAYLGERLDCEVRALGEEAETVFVPGSRRFGRLHLEGALAHEAPADELVERLRRDGVDALLERGERVRVSAVSTEILPRR